MHHHTFCIRNSSTSTLFASELINAMHSKSLKAHNKHFFQLVNYFQQL
jgi:hypothetical protein